MLIRAENLTKTIGAKALFKDLSLKLEPGEKVGIIGRNGVGKSTLFGVLSGQDSHFEGEVIKQRGLKIVATAQEHSGVTGSALDYILSQLPDYARLSQIINTSPETMGHDMTKIQAYSQALEDFTAHGYFDVTNRVLAALGAFQITEKQATGQLTKLSGGQKRFVELVKVMESGAGLALLDEPTNHMDYVAKANFVAWLQAVPQTVAVITHDRDVLQAVDRIIELKDLKAYSYNGNYDAYLSQNSTQTVGDIGQYEVAQRTIANIKKQIAYARSKKAGWGGTADKKNPFVVMEERLKKQLKELEATVGRPQFWIDQESKDQLPAKVIDRYDRYRAKNIKLSGLTHGSKLNWMLRIDRLSLGYAGPLFKAVSCELLPGEHLQFKGRNGAGKTTLVTAIRAAIGQPVKFSGQTYGGSIEFDPKLKVGVYEQEIDTGLLNTSLGEAVMKVFRDYNLPLDQQRVRQTMADYLFDPVADYKLPLAKLSGGQRARFQLIAMLCHQPDLLILDEPTNHLDLPSIEELEKALAGYGGAIIYVSHDSYFSRALGGEIVIIAA